MLKFVVAALDPSAGHVPRPPRHQCTDQRARPRDLDPGRDHTLPVTAIQTGLGATELTGLNIADVHLGNGAHVNCRGKGRKERITPLTKITTAVLRYRRTRRQPGRSALPDQPRTPAHPRRPRAPARQTPGRRRRTLPRTEGQARHAAHAQAHRRHANGVHLVTWARPAMAIRSLTRRAARTGGGGRAMSPTPAPMRRGSSARPPLEASGPTGMKAVVNGGLNLSVLDG